MEGAIAINLPNCSLLPKSPKNILAPAFDFWSLLSHAFICSEFCLIPISKIAECPLTKLENPFRCGAMNP